LAFAESLAGAAVYRAAGATYTLAFAESLAGAAVYRAAGGT
jgi:hypothetical protein